MSHADRSAVAVAQPFERLPDVPMLEITLPRRGTAATHACRWRQGTGDVLDVHGMPAALNFAPHRWLVDASGGIDVSDAVRMGAAIVDVEGGWTRFAFRGERGRRALSSATALGVLLSARRCAATMLFDCPAIVASVDNSGPPEWTVYIAASYAESFSAACERAAAHPE